MSREIKVGSAVKDHFPVFEDNGYTKRSGLLAGDFTVEVFLNDTKVSIATPIGEIGSTGEYAISFVPTSVGLWKIQVLADYNKEIWAGSYVAFQELTNTAVDEIYTLLQSVDADVARVLGLLHHNAILDNQTYDGQGQLTGARLRVFDTAANVPDVPGGSETVGLLHMYQIEAEYSGVGVVSRFALKRVI